MIERVKKAFACKVLWCEGRPCLEYGSREELDRISEYVQAEFGKELLDVFLRPLQAFRRKREPGCALAKSKKPSCQGLNHPCSYNGIRQSKVCETP